MRGITQRFGAVTALESVDLAVPAGTMHAIVGENGAGKTTLMRILFGALSPTSGEVRVEGRPVRFANQREAMAAGIGMVSQHYGIVGELTAIQNLVLGAEDGPLLDFKAATVRADELARRMGFHFDWQAPGSTLSPAAGQKLEILKLLWRQARIMILDEPTAMLSPQDSAAFFESLQKLVGEGATVLLVTHRLPEVMDYCQNVTVLRGGRKVAESEVRHTSAAALAEAIVGRAIARSEGRPGREPGEVLLEGRELTALGSRGQRILDGVSFALRAGEIVGVAGVDGSGQRPLFQSILGVQRLASGTLTLEGGDLLGLTTAERLALGLRAIAEDRHAEAIVEGWSLEENAALGLQRMPPLAKGPLVATRERRDFAQRIAERFRTRHGGLNLPIASLSGGNQQRFVAARALETNPRVLLAFQPARGLDLAGTADVYEAIRERTDAGATALIVSFDLDELLEHCDRILVMNGGRLVPAQTKDRDEIGRLMTGAAA
jgi:simple sugar transport system ATP-binding protein